MVNVDPVGTRAGDVEAVTCTFTDITERRRAEIALEESESLNRRILEAVPGGILHVDASRVIAQANEQARRTLGLRANEIGSVGLDDFADRTIWEDGTPCTVDAHPASRCLETGKRQPPVTIGVRRRDNSISWAVYTAIPLFDPESQRVSGAVVTFLDISERKQIEEHLVTCSASRPWRAWRADRPSLQQSPYRHQRLCVADDEAPRS